MKKGYSLILIFLMIFSVFSVYDVDASVAPSPYAMIDYSDQSGSVDLSTGDMGLSLPVVSIPGIDGGLSYDVNLNYAAGISVDQSPSWVGLGWNLGVPTITRVVRGVPDDYRGEDNNVRVYDKRKVQERYTVLEQKADWDSFWRSLGFSVIMAAGPVINSVMGPAEWGSKQVENTPSVAGASFLTSLPSYLQGAPKYYEQIPKVEEFDSNQRYFDTYGFFYLNPTLGDGDQDNIDYLLEINNPDMFYVNSEIYSGGLTYPNYGPLFDYRGTTGSESYYSCVLPSDSVGGITTDSSVNSYDPNLPNQNYCDNPLSVKFIVQDREFNEIEMVSPDGLVYTFEPVVIVNKSFTRQTKGPIQDPLYPHDCSKLYEDAQDYDYIETELLDPYVMTWGVTKIRSTRNENDYVEFVYSDYVTRNSSDPVTGDSSNEVCKLTPDGKLTYTQVTTTSRTLSRIETKTHYAVFNAGDDMQKPIFLPLDDGTPSPKMKSLSSVDLYYKGNDKDSQSDDVRLNSFKFNYLQDSSENTLRQDETLTLDSVQVCGLDDESCIPETSFEYAFNPVGGPGNYYNWDRWGYYCDSDVCSQGLHNRDGLLAETNGYPDASAWSLTKVNWPSGGSTEWNYESDTFNYVGKRFTPVFTGGARTYFGGGIRVSQVTNCDGFGDCYHTNYNYIDGATNYLPGNYEGSNNDDTYSVFGSGYNSPSVIYNDVEVIPEGDNGKAVYNFTNAKDYPDKGPYLPPVLYQKCQGDNCENVYTYGFSVPESTENSKYILPINQEFLVIGPAGDTLYFFLGTVWGTSYPLVPKDCVYTVYLPSDPETDRCDLSYLNADDAENLVCKTVKIDHCDPKSSYDYNMDRSVFEYYNDADSNRWISDEEGVHSAFVLSRKLSLGNGDVPNAYITNAIFPFIYLPHDDYQYGEINTPHYFSNPTYKYACQDLDSNNICDVEEFPSDQTLDFGGIDFSKFRGLLFSKKIYDPSGNLISSEENVYTGINDGSNGQFDMDGLGFFGYPIHSNQQGKFSAVLNSGSRISVFPYSMWITLKEKRVMQDGKETTIKYTYGANGLPVKTEQTNSDGETLYSIGDYVGQESDDCLAGTVELRSDQAGSDYHVWTAVANTYLRGGDGGLQANLRAEKNGYDTSNKCYLRDNYVWREDPNNPGVVDDSEYGEEAVSEILSRDPLYDRSVVVSDALGRDINTYYLASDNVEDPCTSGDTIGDRLTCTIDPAGNQQRYYYDNYGRVSAIQDTNGMFVNYYYDDLNRLYATSSLTTVKNLIKNPGLELGEDVDASTVVDNWDLSEDAERFSGFARDPDRVHTGKYSVLVKADNTQASVSDAIPVTLGNSYWLSGWIYRSPNVPSDYSTYFDLNDVVSDDNVNANVGKWEWQFVKKKITIPAGINSVNVRFVANGNPNGEWVWFDDVSLSKEEPLEGAEFYMSTVNEYNYGTQGDCDGQLNAGNDNCMNWVQNVGVVGDDFSVARSYVDGLGRHLQTKALKNEGGNTDTVITVKTFYNNRGLVDRVTEPYEEGVSWLSKTLTKIFTGKSDNDILLGYNSDGGDSEQAVKYIYYSDPTARVWKQFPLSTYESGQENLDCGDSGVYCTEYLYNPGDITCQNMDCDDPNYSYQKVVDAEGRYIISKIDKFGNVVEVENAEGNVAETTYDILGQVIDSKDFAGREQKEFPYQDNEYDLLGQLVKSYDLNKEGYSSFEYDDVGRLILSKEAVTTENERDKEIAYDDLDRITKVCLGSCQGGEVITEYFYDENCREKADGTLIQAKGFLCREEGNDGTEINYVYDLKGRLKRINEKIEGVSYTTKYEYDLASNVVKVITPTNEEITYDYNSLGQVEHAYIDGQEFAFEYNPEGSISFIDYPNDVDQTYSYNNLNLVESISVGDIFGEYYTYDEVGNLKELTNTNLVDNPSVTFNYDNLYRLANFTDNGYYNVGFDFVGYRYDQVGNRLNRNVVGNSEFVSTETYNYEGNTDKLASTGDGCIYDYDEFGNMLSKSCGGETTTYEYDENNMITRIDMANGDILRFVYDSQGRRVYKHELIDNGINQPVTGVGTMYVYGAGTNPIVVMSCEIVGDYHMDGKINLADFTLFAQSRNKDYDPLYDLYADGIYNLADLVVYTQGIGKTVSIEGCSQLSNTQQILDQTCDEICADQNLRDYDGCNCATPTKITKEVERVPV